MIKIFIIFALLIGFTLFIKTLGFKRKSSNKKEEDIPEKEEQYPYVKRNYLMTNREREFFFTLKEKYGNEYYIVPQVLLSSIVDVNHYEKHQSGYRSKINKKTLDYVLFDPVYFTPQMVIELDDSSHDLPKRKERDHFVDKVLEQVKIPIAHA